MRPGRIGEPQALADQRRHQLRLWRKRMTWWIPAIFVAGFAVSILGLIPSVAASRLAGLPTPPLIVFALFSIFFGWASVLGLAGPQPTRPRIVPYFSHGLGEYGGETTVAFRRGHGLYREVVQDLEALATVLRVAAGRGVEFSLVLRLQAKDDLQGLSHETRQGSFW